MTNKEPDIITLGSWLHILSKPKLAVVFIGIFLVGLIGYILIPLGTVGAILMGFEAILVYSWAWEAWYIRQMEKKGVRYYIG